MAAGLLIMPQRMPARDRNQRACIGYIRVYDNQTLDEVTVYSDASLTVALSQPITSDASGVFPIIWYDGSNGAVTMAYEGADGQTQSLDDVTASTAAAAAIVNAYAGAVSFTFSTTTADADPGAGKLQFDSGTIASVTNVYIDNTSLGGTSVTGWVDSFDDANTTTNRGTIALRSLTDTSVFVLLKVTGAVTDGTGYRKIPVEYLSGSLPADGAQLVMGFAAAGPSGAAATVTAGTATSLATTASPTVGNSGTSLDAVLNFGIPRGAPGGLLYKFADPTTDSDPGAGKVRFNSATPASITSIYFDNTDGNGNTVTGWLDTFDDSSNTIKGTLTFHQLSNGRVITFDVTGSVVDGTGYRKVTVTHTAGSTLFDDDAEVSVTFERAGDKGADGEGSGDVVGPSSATNNALAQFDGTTGKLLKNGPSLGTSASNVVQLDASAKLPAVDGSQLTNVGIITRDTRTSNTQLAAADKGKLIEITGSGGFTQTFVGASTLGSGWFVHYVNSSTGDITLDPNSTETIGGVNAATTAVLKPGQSTVISSDGSNLFFATQPTGFRNMEVFTASGTFTPKPGVTRYFIRMKGGGGGGCGVSGTSQAPGGSEAGEVSGFVSITAAQTVTIGAGGAGSTGGGTATNGGDSTFGALATANGGKGAAPTGVRPGGSGTFSGGFVERGAPNETGSAVAYNGAGKSGGPANGGAGLNGCGGAGNISLGTGGDGGDGFCIVMW